MSAPVTDGRQLVAFLYLLGRDRLTLGALEDLIARSAGGPFKFSNPHLARWAQETADLLAPDPGATS